MRFALLLAVLLLAPAAAATAQCVSTSLCVDAWSAENGACGGAGFERNVVDVHARAVGDIDARAETYCIRAGQWQYREIRVDIATDSGDTLVRWSDNTDTTCQVLVVANGGPSRTITCPLAPPNVPALL